MLCMIQDGERNIDEVVEKVKKGIVYDIEWEVVE